jgi:predicted metal-dependent enzyme (double-stranded beta helix superfamily)
MANASTERVSTQATRDFGGCDSRENGHSYYWWGSPLMVRSATHPSFSRPRFVPLPTEIAWLPLLMHINHINLILIYSTYQGACDDRGSRLSFVSAAAQLVSPLQQMFADNALAAVSPLAQRHRRVAAALLPYLELPDLLRDVPCPCAPDRYVRHLLHAAEDHTVLALVWRPGQMSPVHGHRSWLGIHRGSMTETQFSFGAQGPVPRPCVQHGVGNISHAPPEPGAIHRLANLGTETAVSQYDRLGHELNQVWAA